MWMLCLLQTLNNYSSLAHLHDCLNRPLLSLSTLPVSDTTSIFSTRLNSLNSFLRFHGDCFIATLVVTGVGSISVIWNEFNWLYILVAYTCTIGIGSEVLMVLKPTSDLRLRAIRLPSWLWGGSNNTDDIGISDLRRWVLITALTFLWIDRTTSDA